MAAAAAKGRIPTHTSPSLFPLFHELSNLTWTAHGGGAGGRGGDGGRGGEGLHPDKKPGIVTSKVTSRLGWQEGTTWIESEQPRP